MTMIRQTSLFSIAGLAFLLLSFLPAPLELTPEERAKAVQELTGTRDYFSKAVAGMREEQLDFKAGADKWSIRQCMEHIALSEKMLFGWVSAVMAQPAEPAKKDSVKVTDEIVLKGVTDRSTKFQAPEMLQPAGKFPSAGAAADAFYTDRDKLIAFMKTTEMDMRNHFMQHPALGWIDTYQGILLLSAHTRRHTLQIEEVKADPRFPK
jgi:hypothetical protein